MALRPKLSIKSRCGHRPSDQITRHTEMVLPMWLPAAQHACSLGPKAPLTFSLVKTVDGADGGRSAELQGAPALLVVFIFASLSVRVFNNIWQRHRLPNSRAHEIIHAKAKVAVVGDQFRMGCPNYPRRLA